MALEEEEDPGLDDAKGYRWSRRGRLLFVRGGPGLFTRGGDDKRVVPLHIVLRCDTVVVETPQQDPPGFGIEVGACQPKESGVGGGSHCLTPGGLSRG